MTEDDIDDLIEKVNKKANPAIESEEQQQEEDDDNAYYRDQIIEQESKRYSPGSQRGNGKEKEPKPKPKLECKLTEQDIKFVIDTMQKEARHDRLSIMQLLY